MNIRVELKATGVSVVLEGVEAKEINKMFEIGDDYVGAMEQQPALQTFWGCVSADMMQQVNNFKEIDFEKFMAHIKKYAGYIMKATGQKDTIEGKKELSMQVFSNDRTPEERYNFSKLAYAGYLVQYRSVPADFINTIENDPVEKSALDAFIKIMYSYQSNGLFYEDVIRQKNSKEYQSECLRTIADSLRQRGFLLNGIAEVRREWAMDESKQVGGDSKKFDSLVQEVIKKVTMVLRKEREVDIGRVS